MLHVASISLPTPLILDSQEAVSTQRNASMKEGHTFILHLSKSLLSRCHLERTRDSVLRSVPRIQTLECVAGKEMKSAGETNRFSLISFKTPIKGREAKRLKCCVFSPPSFLPVPGRGKEARKRNLSITSQSRLGTRTAD